MGLQAWNHLSQVELMHTTHTHTCIGLQALYHINNVSTYILKSITFGYKST